MQSDIHIFSTFVLLILNTLNVFYPYDENVYVKCKGSHLKFLTAVTTTMLLVLEQPRGFSTLIHFFHIDIIIH